MFVAVTVFGAGLLLLAVGMAVRELLWLRAAHFCEGTVVDLVKKPGRTYRPLYAPRVRFRAADGSNHEFTRSTATCPPGYSKGDSVRIAYHPVTHEARIFTFAQFFGMAAVMGLLGLIATWAGLVSMLANQR